MNINKYYFCMNDKVKIIARERYTRTLSDNQMRVRKIKKKRKANKGKRK